MATAPQPTTQPTTAATDRHLPAGERAAGERFVDALAAKDRTVLTTLLAPDVDFRAMTPGRFWEATSADDVIAVLLEQWFEPDDQITGVYGTAPADVEDRHRVTYRFGVTNAAGHHVVEQTAYYDADDAGRITLLRVICSGFRPTTAPR